MHTYQGSKLEGLFCLNDFEVTRISGQPARENWTFCSKFYFALYIWNNCVLDWFWTIHLFTLCATRNIASLMSSLVKCLFFSISNFPLYSNIISLSWINGVKQFNKLNNNITQQLNISPFFGNSQTHITTAKVIIDAHYIPLLFWFILLR